VYLSGGQSVILSSLDELKLLLPPSNTLAEPAHPSLPAVPQKAVSSASSERRTQRISWSTGRLWAMVGIDGHRYSVKYGATTQDTISLRVALPLIQLVWKFCLFIQTSRQMPLELKLRGGGTTFARVLPKTSHLLRRLCSQRRHWRSVARSKTALGA
jgi:hypothetical protein